MVLVDRGTEPAPQTIAGDGVPGAAADGVGHGRGARTVRHRANPDRAGAASPRLSQCVERRTVSDAPDQAASRLRPRWRRDWITARPPRVRIRTRNPWVLLRFRLLG
jgi:hypothetical protein